MFLEISHNLQKNTCARVSFFNFTKKEALAQVFSCEFCEILKNTFFTENLWTIASSYDSLRRLLKGQKYDGMNQSRSKQ